MNWQNLDLNLLRVLDAMLVERSTVRVGERVGLSQPAVSSALNRLRHALGDPLFVREGNRMVATPFAEAIETPLRQALDRIERALSGTPFDPARSTRVFRVLGDNILAVILLPALMAQLADEAPGVHFQLSPVSPRAVADQFADGSIDLAFLPEFTPETLPDWVERVPLFTDVAVAIAGSNNERLAREGVRPGATIPMALFCEMRHALFAPRGATEGEEDKALAAAGRTRKVVATVPDFFSVARLVAETDLIGTVPIAFALPLAERLGFATYRLPFAMPPAYLDLYWHRRHADDPEHRWMREKIIALLTPLANSLPLELAGASAASRRRQTPIKRPIR